MRLSLVLLLLLPALQAAPNDGLLTLDSPLLGQIIQRTTQQQGVVHFSGKTTGAKETPDTVEIQSYDSDLQKVSHHSIPVKDASFTADLTFKPGAYRFEITLTRQQKVVGQFRMVAVGIGEVFYVTGQSNSANHGEVKMACESEYVQTFTGKAWQECIDPQPGASGNGGSFMPELGDELEKRLHVPIGFVAGGIGATSVREWLPAGVKFTEPPTLHGRVRALPDGTWESNGKAYDTLIERLKVMGIHGVRAVLWHQGESDAHQKDPHCTLSGEKYQTYLGLLIKRSRQDIGWDVPWMVAQVSYHTPDDPGSDEIRQAQAALWHQGLALQGPDSDALKGDLRERKGQGVHFSAAGLRAHAHAWAEQLVPWIQSQP